MLVLSVVLMVPVAAAVVGFFLDDVAEAVEARHYPALPPARPLGLGRAGRRRAALLRAGGRRRTWWRWSIYFAVPPLAPFVFWLVNGFLLGREYFQLVALRRRRRAGGGGALAAAFLADLAGRHRDGGAAERAGAQPRGADRSGSRSSPTSSTGWRR